ncbi:hypothetical protein FRB93_005004 [Tulasnella sp. JGI-2019a]|nr:hypothetical protein FRB93_005004 [Tulasnella sp. JGI-2019a]
MEQVAYDLGATIIMSQVATDKYTVKVPAASKPAPSGVLKVSGREIVGEDGKPVILRGAGLGGHLNMENFITGMGSSRCKLGYPGHEKYMRKAVKKVLGEEKYNYFFDKFLEYFFAEEDAKFFASLGFNCIRIAVNYRHLEDDFNPGVFIEKGFQWIDRIINLCAAEGIYTILDLHAAPGGQNGDWHSDTGIHIPLFWEHIEFQNRTVAIWEALAARYKGNTWVAGYNPLNEPCDEEHYRLLAFYDRVEAAIRKVDPDHILFWDGNTFAADMSKFKDPLPNSVYAIHDYSTFGFPGSEPYTGAPEQKAKMLRSFERKITFQERTGGPIWNGEWGPVYANADDDKDWEDINKVRYSVLKDQLEIYEERKLSWSIWLYKDIGFQGMVYASPESAYIKKFKPFLQKKKRLAADEWGVDLSTVQHLFQPLEDWLREEVPGIKQRYPPMWNVSTHVGRVLRNILLSEELYPEYAAYFEGLSLDDLDALAASFKFENCVQRQGLNEAIKPKP